MKIKLSLLSLLFTLILLSPNSIYAAAYKLPSQLINLPIYTAFDKGDIISGISVGTTSSANYSTEFDVNVYYAVSKHFITGINFASQENIVFNMHYSFLADPLSKFKIVGGLMNIPINGDTTIQEYKEFDYLQSNAYSPYLVGSYHHDMIHLHLGYGGNQYKYESKDDALIPGIPGLIFGMQIPVNNMSFGVEYDGKDLNLGTEFILSEKTHLYLSLTELTQPNDTNPQYNNQPRRIFNMGVRHHFNKKHKTTDIKIKKALDDRTTELKETIQDINNAYEKELNNWRNERNEIKKEMEKYRSIVKEDLDYINEENKEQQLIKREQYLSKSQEISERVLSLYYESLELFSENEHYKAIATLQEAIRLNPYLPQLYIRLGSIYYDLQLNDMAVIQWQKALELDPNNSRLKSFLNNNL